MTPRDGVPACREQAGAGTENGAAREGIVLLGHGTKDPDGVAEFLGYAQGIRERSGSFLVSGVLEYPNERLPTIQQAFDRAADEGLTEVVGLPVLLFFAGHTRDDMPEQLEQARWRHPDMRIALAGPLGVDERLLLAVEERLAPYEPDEDTAILLVGRGSLNSEANADLYKTARMLWDRNRFGWVETAFVSVTPPGVEAGIQRCLRLGARRIVVMPYFLNTGVLVKRIAQQARHSRIEVRTAEHLGLHPLVLDVLLQRLADARAGICPCRAGMGCRLPKLDCSGAAACLQPVGAGPGGAPYDAGEYVSEAVNGR